MQCWGKLELATIYLSILYALNEALITCSCSWHGLICHVAYWIYVNNSSKLRSERWIAKLACSQRLYSINTLQKKRNRGIGTLPKKTKFSIERTACKGGWEGVDSAASEICLMCATHPKRIYMYCGSVATSGVTMWNMHADVFPAKHFNSYISRISPWCKCELYAWYMVMSARIATIMFTWEHGTIRISRFTLYLRTDCRDVDGIRDILAFAPAMQT